MNLFNPPKYVNLKLIGIDGNAFVIMSEFRRSAIKQHWSNDDIDKVLNEAMSSDYNHLLATIRSHCKM